MALTNRTLEFQEIVGDRKDPRIGSKEKRSSQQSSVHVGNDSSEAGRKEYITEAYKILNHINMLTGMLGDIRKAYLNVDYRATASARTSRDVDLTSGDRVWKDTRYLSNEERDQIDLQARVILSRCADRVKEMETIEKQRAELVARQRNPLARFLPARLVQDSSSSSDFISAHHASITWFLSRRLTEASQMQKEMQEERIKRQVERTQTLGSSATRDAQRIDGSDSLTFGGTTARSSATNWLGGATSTLASSFALNFGGSSSGPSLAVTNPDTQVSDDFDDDDSEMELTQSQILQFETENANILRSVQDTLESVQQAEARLMDISALQMQLVAHLTQQTELTDQLYEDAIATTTTVEKGNVQLREAKRRARDSRKFILLFLIGASLSLLFLHYY